VYRTFTPHDQDAYYDAVPFQTRFRKMKGVVDFYEAFTRGFPDFQITVHTEQDVPGVSIREAQITGTHKGEYCGIQATGRRVSIALMGFFLFDRTTGHLNAERIYFDNNNDPGPAQRRDVSRRRLRPQPNRAGRDGFNKRRVSRTSGPNVDQAGVPACCDSW